MMTVKVVLSLPSQWIYVFMAAHLPVVVLMATRT